MYDKIHFNKFKYNFIKIIIFLILIHFISTDDIITPLDLQKTIIGMIYKDN